MAAVMRVVMVVVVVMMMRGVARQEEDAGSEMLPPLDQYHVRGSHDAPASTPHHRVSDAAGLLLL